MSGVSIKLSNAGHSIHAHHRKAEHQTVIVDKQDHKHFCTATKSIANSLIASKNLHNSHITWQLTSIGTLSLYLAEEKDIVFKIFC